MKTDIILWQLRQLKKPNSTMRQIDIISRTSPNMLNPFTLACPEEAIGIASAVRAAHMPVVISFEIETDGKLQP